MIWSDLICNLQNYVQTFSRLSDRRDRIIFNERNSFGKQGASDFGMLESKIEPKILKFRILLYFQLSASFSKNPAAKFGTGLRQWLGSLPTYLSNVTYSNAIWSLFLELKIIHCEFEEKQTLLLKKVWDYDCVTQKSSGNLSWNIKVF